MSVFKELVGITTLNYLRIHIHRQAEHLIYLPNQID